MDQCIYLDEPCSERTRHWMWTYPTGEPHWLGTTGRENFLNDTDGILRGDWAKQWSGESYVHVLWSHHRDVFNYFDDWILIEANEDNTEIRNIFMRKKEQEHIETIA